jgi:hypothetical protein
MVTVTDEVTTKFDYVPLFSWVGDCPPDSPREVSSNSVTEMLLRQRRGIDRRIKPTYPTPTTQPYVISYRRKIGSLKYHLGWYRCSATGVWYRQYMHFYDHGVVSNEVLPIEFDSNLYNKRLQDRIEDLRVDYGNTAAEIDELFGMISTTINVVKEVQYCVTHPFSKRCRKHYLDWKKSKGKWKAVPAAWIQYAFGIAPIVGVLNDTVEKMNNPNGNTANVRFTMVTDQYKQIETSGRILDYHSEYISRMRGVVTFKNDSNTNAFKDCTFGSPATWIWERIPFSFVVDWIIPVGSYIAQFNAYQGIESVNGTLSHRGKHSMKQVGTSVPVFIMENPCELLATSHVRDIAPLPGYWSLFPQVKQYNTNRLLTQLSLLALLSKRK